VVVRQYAGKGEFQCHLSNSFHFSENLVPKKKPKRKKKIQSYQNARSSTQINKNYYMDTYEFKLGLWC